MSNLYRKVEYDNISGKNYIYINHTSGSEMNQSSFWIPLQGIHLLQRTSIFIKKLQWTLDELVSKMN